MPREAIEMRSLAAPPPPPAHAELEDGTIAWWAYTSASLLALSSLSLTLFPRLLLFLSESTTTPERRTALTPLESFLSLHLGIWLAAISLTLILNIPSTAPLVTAAQKDAPPGHPLLAPLAGAGILTSFLAYNTHQVGPLASIAFVGSAVIGLWGIWTITFAGSALVSKKTGADKHTSSFLFGNKSSASVQKRLWRRGGKTTDTTL